MAEEKKVLEASKKAPAKKAAAPKAEGAKKAPAKKAPAKKVEAAEQAPKAKKVVASELNRVEKKYREEIIPELMKEFGYKTPMEAPKLVKIVINIGVGDATQNAKALEDSVADLTLIAGQKPVVTHAKKSIATFKLREGQAIGCKVTLRGKRMYEFYDKLVSIALPRVRDFRGVSRNAFDGHGNYTLGVKEQLIFPEIDYDKIGKIRGMDIVIVTTAKKDEEALSLLTHLGMPFRH